MHTFDVSIATFRDIESGSARSNLAPSVGERNPAARVTAEKVRAIRVAHEAGGNLADIARAFTISPRAARHIVRRTSWVHVE